MKAVSRALILASMLIPSAAAAQQQRLSDNDMKAIVTEVIEHFRSNPQELIQAIVAGTKAEPAPKAPAADFTGAAVDPWYGKGDAPISIMVFSDYGCGPCNDVEKVLDRIVDSRSDVKVVHRDYPVSGEDAVAASLDVLSAFNAKADWMKLRAEFMNNGIAPEYRIQALKAAGIEQSGEVSAAVKLTLLKNRELAQRAGVNTLPAVIVMKGEGVVPISGDITAQNVQEAIRLLEAD